MEIKVEVEPSVWQKFEQISNDIGKDRNKVFTELVEKAHAEFEKEKKEEK